MTKVEREMMNTIHLYGLIFSLDGGGKDAASDYMAPILKEEQSGNQI